MCVACGCEKVYATDGDEMLGGSDLDMCLYDMIKQRVSDVLYNTNTYAMNIHIYRLVSTRVLLHLADLSHVWMLVCCIVGGNSVGSQAACALGVGGRHPDEGRGRHRELGPLSLRQPALYGGIGNHPYRNSNMNVLM